MYLEVFSLNLFVYEFPVFGHKRLFSKTGQGLGRIVFLVMGHSTLLSDEAGIKLPAAGQMGMEHRKWKCTVNKICFLVAYVLPVARPAPCSSFWGELGPDRVKMNIAYQFQEVGIFLTENRLVSSLKQVPEASVSDVKVFGVSGQQPLHDERQREPVDLHQEVDVVGHQTVRVEKEGSLLFEVGENFQEELAICLIPESFLSSIAACHSVKEGAGEMNSGRPGHGRDILSTFPTVKPDTDTRGAAHLGERTFMDEYLLSTVPR